MLLDVTTDEAMNSRTARLDYRVKLMGGQRSRVCLVVDHDHLLAVSHLLQGHPVLLLDPFGLVRRDAQQLGDVLGHELRGERDAGGIRQLATAQHADVGRTATDIDQQRRHLALSLAQHRQPGGHRLHDHPVHADAGIGGAAAQVLERAVRTGDEVYIDLQPHPGHAYRILDAVMAIHHVLLRDDVQYFHVRFQRYCLGVVNRTLDIRPGDLLIAPDGRHSVACDRLQVRAGDTDPSALWRDAGDPAGSLHRLPYRFDRPFQVDDHTFAQAVTRYRTLTDDIEHTVTGDLADDGADLGGTDVQTHDDAFVTHYIRSLPRDRPPGGSRVCPQLPPTAPLALQRWA